MAAFNAGALSPTDQQAFQAWQQQVQALIQQSGGGIPAPVSYAMQHPEYLTSHPEIRSQTDLLTGKTLPPAVQQQIQGSHLDTSGSTPTFSENKGFWSHPESWLQLAFGIGLGGVAATGLAGTAASAGTSGISSGIGGEVAALPALSGTTAATTAASTGGLASRILPFIKSATGVGGSGGNMTTADWIKLGTQAAGKIAQGREQGRQVQAGQNAEQDRLRQAADQLGMQNANRTEQLPAERQRAAISGDILAGIQRPQFVGDGRNLSLIGGASPDLFSNNTRNLGQAISARATGGSFGSPAAGGDANTVSRQAMLDSLAPSTYEPFKPTFTGPTPLPQASGLDTVLQTGGYVGDAASLLDSYKKRQQQLQRGGSGGYSTEEP